MLVVIFVSARFSVRAVRILTEAVASGKLTLGWLEPDLAVPTRRILTIAIWALSLVMAAPHLPGSDSKAFLGVAIMLGILLSLGASSVTSNLLAGLMITYSRAYRVGDRVQIGEHAGKVMSVGVLTTRLRSEEGREIVIPNAVVQGATITHLEPRARDMSTLDAFELLPHRPSLTSAPPASDTPSAPSSSEGEASPLSVAPTMMAVMPRADVVAAVPPRRATPPRRPAPFASRSSVPRRPPCRPPPRAPLSSIPAPPSPPAPSKKLGRAPPPRPDKEPHSSRTASVSPPISVMPSPRPPSAAEIETAPAPSVQPPPLPE